MIRQARHTDTVRLMEMGARFIAETSYARLVAADPSRMLSIVEGVLAASNGAIFVSDIDGSLTGMIGVLVYPHPFSNELTGFDLFWWVEPEARGHGVRLMRAAEEWAKDRGATKMQMVAPSPRVETLYARLGYEPIEVAYQRSL